jgi:hypothetical protein
MPYQAGGAAMPGQPMPYQAGGGVPGTTLLEAFNGDPSGIPVPPTEQNGYDLPHNRPIGPGEEYGDLSFELPPGSLDPDVYGEGLTQLDIMEAVKGMAGQDSDFFQWLYGIDGPLGAGTGAFNLEDTLKEFKEAQQQGIDELFQIIGGEGRDFPSAPMMVAPKPVIPPGETPYETERKDKESIPKVPHYIKPQDYAGMVAQEVAARPKLSFKEFLGQKTKGYREAYKRYGTMRRPVSRQRRGENVLVRSI